MRRSLNFVFFCHSFARVILVQKHFLQTNNLFSFMNNQKRIHNQDFLLFQLKEMCRRELDRLDTENKRNAIIIADYKQVGYCKKLEYKGQFKTQFTSIRP